MAQRNSDDIEGFFELELTQEPMSLFSKSFLRKPDKSCLRKSNLKDEAAITKEQFQDNSIFAIDGGVLLHRVWWKILLLTSCAIFMRHTFVTITDLVW